MDWLTSLGLGFGGPDVDSQLQQQMRDGHTQWFLERQRNAYNRAASGKPITTPLEDCITYFRNEGLTPEEMRKAITPILFTALSKKLYK